MTEQEFPQKQQELFEAVVALIAVGILTSMVFWMKQAARHQGAVAGLHRCRTQPWPGSGLCADRHGLFAVAREGLESVFFLLAAFQQQAATPSLAWRRPAGLLVAWPWLGYLPGRGAH
jgi:high-affinity iron transporter